MCSLRSPENYLLRLRRLQESLELLEACQALFCLRFAVGSSGRAQHARQPLNSDILQLFLSITRNCFVS